MGRAAGERIGPYELVRVLGAGGSGQVWEAVLHGPAGFRKPVALKLLHGAPADDERRAALVREARLGALLQHPNVVATLQLGQHDGAWCIALELVHGASIAALCRQVGGRLPPSAVLDVGVQAAAGLHHVHGLRVHPGPAGLVHRDVKPGNLLVDRSGIVEVALVLALRAEIRQRGGDAAGARVALDAATALAAGHPTLVREVERVAARIGAPRPVDPDPRLRTS